MKMLITLPKGVSRRDMAYMGTYAQEWLDGKVHVFMCDKRVRIALFDDKNNFVMVTSGKNKWVNHL
jgi:hypothetical protein